MILGTGSIKQQKWPWHRTKTFGQEPFVDHCVQVFLKCNQYYRKRSPSRELKNEKFANIFIFDPTAQYVTKNTKDVTCVESKLVTIISPQQLYWKVSWSKSNMRSTCYLETFMQKTSTSRLIATVSFARVLIRSLSYNSCLFNVHLQGGKTSRWRCESQR